MNDSFIYDFETLSQNLQIAPVLSVAMMAFDTKRFLSENPYTVEEIMENAVYHKYDSKEQIEKYGRKPQESTVKWWGGQSAEAIASQVMPKDTDESFTLIPQHFRQNITNSIQHVYTRGNTFDPILLKHVCEQLNQEYPYPWWAERDTRSLLDGMTWGTDLGNKFDPKGVDSSTLPLHDPRVDIMLDIMRMQTVVRILFLGEEI